TRWARNHNPDVFCLSEARTHQTALAEVPGYTVFQSEPVRSGGPIVNDQGDSAILVRDDLGPVLREPGASMLLKGVVFGHNRTHTPRQYQGVDLKKGGKKFRIRASHFPTHGFDGGNKRAFLESATRSKVWALAGLRAVSLDVGDLNEKLA